mmetsp:Transcript_6808/g.18853  ORF Transcript_6808/g.18853 Transcript_6808/m.18853 type:complete len:278 (-) Transcript_6808:46-879(-)
MQPALGILRAAPDDGVLRGRVGAKRWLGLFCGLSVFGCIIFGVCVASFAERRLVQLIVFLVIGCLVVASFRICFHPCAWMGLDLNLPVVFDLSSDGLEVGVWRQLEYKRHEWQLSDLRDLRVYHAAADLSADGGASLEDARPLRDAATLASQLPRPRDVLRECGQTFLQLCSAVRPATGVACAFVAAKVVGHEEPVQLSRCAWLLSDVEEAFKLARAARQRAGLPEAFPAQDEPTVLGAVVEGAIAAGDEEEATSSGCCTGAMPGGPAALPEVDSRI